MLNITPPPSCPHFNTLIRAMSFMWLMEKVGICGKKCCIVHTHSCSRVYMAENSLVITLVKLKKHFDLLVFLVKNNALYNIMNIKLSKISRFDADIY